MAILNKFSAILVYCDSTQFFACCCGMSGDSRPAILGIVRFAIRDSVLLRSVESRTLSDCSMKGIAKRGLKEESLNSASFLNP